jgi:uncharacterized repeat protein (TIGR02543 family)
MATSSGTNSRKPSGRVSTSSSRLYIAVLAAAVAAFFVVPVAQAAAGTVKVKTAGTGTGKVREIGLFTSPSEPEPINCPSVCEATMSESSIALGSFAGEGSEFVGWTITKGSAGFYCDGSEEEKNAAAEIGGEFPEYAGMDGICLAEEAGGAVEITATFNTVPSGPKLTIAKTGEGTVVSSPAGIECTGAKTGAECEAGFTLNSTVTLTASPASGYAFSAWAGCTEHVGLTCKVKMEKAKTVKVTFVATPLLTIEKTGSGQGKVGATGISCDENCPKATSAIKTGTLVTVKVTPAKGSEAAVFENGTGSASGCSGASCTFTISANSSVKVKFNAAPTKTLTVNLTGPAKYKGKVSGKGTVKGLTSSAISCGTGCTTETESFFASDTVTLTAVAGTGYTFAGWSGSEAGTCTGTNSPCTIPTNANKTLSAEFK